MSITWKVAADAPASVTAPREPISLWTAALILGVVVATLAGAWFFIDAPVIDVSMVAP
jgi:hypothetical protein